MVTTLQHERLSRLSQPENYSPKIKTDDIRKSWRRFKKMLWGIFYRYFGVERLSDASLKSLKGRTIDWLTHQQIATNIPRLKEKQLYKLTKEKVATLNFDDQLSWISHIAFPAIISLLEKHEWSMTEKRLEALSKEQKVALLFYAHLHKMDPLKATLECSLQELEKEERHEMVLQLLNEMAYPTHEEEWENILIDVVNVFWQKWELSDSAWQSLELPQKASCVRFAFASGKSVERVLTLSKGDDPPDLENHCHNYMFSTEIRAFVQYLRTEKDEYVLFRKLTRFQQLKLVIYAMSNIYVKEDNIERWLKNRSREECTSLFAALEKHLNENQEHFPDEWNQICHELKKKTDRRLNF